MPTYYVNQNAQANGDHEVHTNMCAHFAKIQNRLYLGDFTSCAPAVAQAKKIYSKADGCFYCCNACHTS
jgi:hypothetical protein